MEVMLVCVLVSMDAFFVGASFGAISKYKIKKTLISLCLVFVICMASFGLALLVQQFVVWDLNIIIGIVFVLFGIKSLFDKKIEEVNLGKIVWLSLALATDGALAVFSMNPLNVFAPFWVALAHFIFLTMGWLMGRKIKHKNITSGIALVLLGGLKLFGIL